MIELTEQILDQLDWAFPFNFWPFPGMTILPDPKEVCRALCEEYDYFVPV